jgi:hypothetical protein
VTSSLTVREYERMVEAGVFGEDEHLELLEGVIVASSAQGPHDSRVIQRLCDPLFTGLPAEFIARCQLPLALSRHSEPEPDVAIVGRDVAGSPDAHPTTAALIFEVAGDSLRKDRVAKGALYAGAGIPEYVIANVEEKCLEVNRDPDQAARRYRSVSRLSAQDPFESSAVPGLAFEVEALFS